MNLCIFTQQERYPYYKYSSPTVLNRFFLKLRAPTSTIDHYLPLTRYKTYPWSAFYALSRTKQIQICFHNSSREYRILLQSLLHTHQIVSFFNSCEMTLPALSQRRTEKSPLLSPRNPICPKRQHLFPVSEISKETQRTHLQNT